MRVKNILKIVVIYIIYHFVYNESLRDKIDMINHEEIKAELKILETLSRKIDKCLRRTVDGTIYFVQYSKNSKPIPYWNRMVDGKRIRKPLKGHEKDLLIPLKYKTFAMHLKQRTEVNIDALKAILRYKPFDTKFRSFGGEPFRECREFFFGTVPDNPEFEALEERQNPFHPEQLNVQTELGVFRSREEYIVARALTILGLRFKYETPLPTPYRYHYPDFAVLHPKTGKIIYIEYSGMMKNAEYRRSVLTRLKDYGDAGVYLGYNLFFISTVAEDGINMASILSMLKGIFEL